jgi:hypothetical protein
MELAARLDPAAPGRDRAVVAEEKRLSSHVTSAAQRSFLAL